MFEGDQVTVRQSPQVAGRAVDHTTTRSRDPQLAELLDSDGALVLEWPKVPTLE